MFEIMSLKEVRKTNESLILHLLNKNGPMSRKDIAIALKLTPAAITKITADLIREGLIKEVGSNNENIGRVGRREVIIEISIKDKIALCIHTEGEKLTVSLAIFNGELIDSKAFELPKTIEETIVIVKNFLTKFDENITNHIYAIGVCIIGSNNEYSIWKDADIKGTLENAFGKKVVVKNNVAAFAEAELLYDKNIQNIKGNTLVFKWGPGLGSSIIYNGKVTDSDGNETFEIGHCIVTDKGKKCRCGRYGCLECEVQISNKLERKELEFEIEQKSYKIAVALENAYTLISAKKIILFGEYFEDEFAKDKLIENCKKIYPEFNVECMEISELNKIRTYIGGVAICAKKFIFDRK